MPELRLAHTHRIILSLSAASGYMLRAPLRSYRGWRINNAFNADLIEFGRWIGSPLSSAEFRSSRPASPPGTIAPNNAPAQVRERAPPRSDARA
jgi:hypothetical protein